MADTRTLFDLMSWMSPAWPIGAFSYSSGLEWAVEAGHVTGIESCERWLSDLLAHGAMQGDIILFVHGWRAVQGKDRARLMEVAELGAANQTGRERRLEATAQGAAFRRIAIDTAPCGQELREMLAEVDDADLTYPVAVAVLFALNDVELAPGLTAFLHGAVSNLVSAAQRLVPLGQTDSQRLLACLREPILAAASEGAVLPCTDPFDQIASAAFLAEIGCMAHETQYTRLFRT